MAVKKCPKEKYLSGLDNSADMSQMLCELRVLEDMDHPHIVHVFEMLEDDNHFYIVMEEVKGGTLVDLLEKIRSNEDLYYTG